MENEGYIYPQKIHRTKQTNFEPLEIHYKVHSYAYKQLNIIKTQIKKKDFCFNSFQINNNLKALYANLKRFSFHAIEQKGISTEEFYVKDPIQLLANEKLGSLVSSINYNIDDDECYIIDDLQNDISQLVNFFSFCFFFKKIF